MAEVTSNESAAGTPAVADRGSFFKRQLHGTAFLSLEHFMHLALVVVVAALLSAGIATLVGLWGNGGSTAANMLFGGSTASLLGDSFKTVEAMSALGIVAGLLVTVPLLMILDRRTAAEWAKRPGYSARLAYKLPIYGALAVLVTVKTVAFIAMVSIVLQSVALIGVNGEDVGRMYLTDFVPALITLLVFGAAGWYVLKLAKGRDLGKFFSGAAAGFAVVLAITLFITAYLALHAPRTNDTYTNPYGPGSTPSTRDFEDIFKY